MLEAISGLGISAIPKADAGSSYEIATELGAAPSNWDNIGEALKGHARNKVQEYEENIDAFLEEIKKDDLFGSGGIDPKDLSPKAHEFFSPILYVSRLGYEAAEAYCKALKTVAKATVNTEFKDVEPRPAMGYSGPDMTDKFMQQLDAQGKLIIVDQKKWLFSHSGMQVPSEDMYKEVYKDEIWDLLKKTGFGRY